ncbi:hypothetical protein OCAR_5010 [Afipia carboxidovorans OM5]|nr:hypothetical protein OCAR_5010 [Afipia carboxidovorans OM5]
MATDQAAGLSASIAVGSNTTVRDISTDSLQVALRKSGCRYTTDLPQ